MSDPVTNVAIEDVLSSIRRLVSEDARIRPLAPQSEPASDADLSEGQGAEVNPGKLVLTPALRVADAPQTNDHNDIGGEPVADMAGPAPEGMSPPEDVLPAMQEQQVTDAEAGGDGYGFDSIESDVTDLDRPDAAISAEQTDRLDLADSAMEPAAQAEEPSAPEALAWEDHNDDAFMDSPVADEASAPSDDAYHADDDLAEGYEPEFAAASVVETADLQEEAGAPASDHAAKSGEFVFASTRDSGMSHDAVFAAADPDRHIDEGDDDQPSLFGEDKTLIDEETLRELVTEIVRQELQGALGERITRNVRKLVRREIHRALTSQELE